MSFGTKHVRQQVQLRKFPVEDNKMFIGVLAENDMVNIIEEDIRDLCKQYGDVFSLVEHEQKDGHKKRGYLKSKYIKDSDDQPARPAEFTKPTNLRDITGKFVLVYRNPDHGPHAPVMFARPPQVNICHGGVL